MIRSRKNLRKINIFGVEIFKSLSFGIYRICIPKPYITNIRKVRFKRFKRRCSWRIHVGPHRVPPSPIARLWTSGRIIQIRTWKRVRKYMKRAIVSIFFSWILSWILIKFLTIYQLEKTFGYFYHVFFQLACITTATSTSSDLQVLSSLVASQPTDQQCEAV